MVRKEFPLPDIEVVCEGQQQHLGAGKQAQLYRILTLLMLSE